MLVSLKHSADPCGYCSRPELLWLGVDTREKKHVRAVGEGGVAGVRRFNGMRMGDDEEGKANETVTP